MAVQVIQSALERIRERIPRAITNLKVTIQNHKPEGVLPDLLIEGSAKLFYHKQLAQEAVKGLAGQYRVQNNIVVEDNLK